MRSRQPALLPPDPKDMLGSPSSPLSCNWCSPLCLEGSWAQGGSAGTRARGVLGYSMVAAVPWYSLCWGGQHQSVCSAAAGGGVLAGENLSLTLASGTEHMLSRGFKILGIPGWTSPGPTPGQGEVGGFACGVNCQARGYVPVCASLWESGVP